MSAAEMHGALCVFCQHLEKSLVPATLLGSQMCFPCMQPGVSAAEMHGARCMFCHHGGSRDRLDPIQMARSAEMPCCLPA